MKLLQALTCDYQATVEDAQELVVVDADLLAGWACKIHSMARYSVDSTMPAALSACQGLPPSAPGLDAACPEARLPSPSCTSAGQSTSIVLEGEHIHTAETTDCGDNTFAGDKCSGNKISQ